MNFISGSKKTIIVEEHFRSGGLGSSILELCNDYGVNSNVIKLIGIPDKFPDQNPNHDKIKEYWGLDKKNLFNKMLKEYGIRK